MAWDVGRVVPQQDRAVRGCELTFNPSDLYCSALTLALRAERCLCLSQTTNLRSTEVGGCRWSSSVAERVLGKDEVVSSTLTTSLDAGCRFPVADRQGTV